MNIGFITYQEILNVKLAEKQAKVIQQIDSNIQGLTKARMTFSPDRVNLETDEQVVTRINELLGIRKQCISLETFVTVELATLDTYKIDYKSDLE